VLPGSIDIMGEPCEINNVGSGIVAVGDMGCLSWTISLVMVTGAEEFSKFIL